MGIIGKVSAAVVGGLLFALLGFMVVSMPLASSGFNSVQGWLVWCLWLVAIVIVFMAKNAGKAWRRLLISCAVFSLMLPVSTLLMNIIGFSDASMPGGEYSGAASAGALVGGGMTTLFSGFVGFFLAAIFLVIGLMIGKDRSDVT